ncbi:AAA family ATPase [Nonomuraea maritima]|uniref:AAA family ATPase n=1 Tax=Nonomuraea maritima TaxID=683260 RepID=UPI00371C0C06
MTAPHGRTGSDPAAGARAGREARLPLVGRRRELVAITQLLERAMAGDGGRLVVTGPPGSGKSALLAAAAEQARTRGMPVFRATGTGPATELPGRTARSLDHVHAEGEPCLLLVDDADRAGGPAGDLLARLAAHLGSGATALIATTSAPAGPAPELHLRGLTEPELAELVPALSPDAVHAVWLASGGLPGPALALAGELTGPEIGEAGELTGPAQSPAGEPAGPGVGRAEEVAGPAMGPAGVGPAVDAVLRLALTAPSRAEFLDLDVGLIRLLEAAAERPAPPGVRARVLARLARELLGDASAGPRRRDLIDEAVQLARRSAAPGTIAEVLDARLHALWDPAAAGERLATASEIVEQARQAGDAEAERRGLFWRFTALTELGELVSAEAALTAYARAGELAGDPAAAVVVLARQAMLATVRGRFEAAEALAAEVRVRGRQAGLSDADRLAGALGGEIASLRGEYESLVAPWQGLARRLPGHFFEASAARALAGAGRGDEAALELERLLPAVLSGSGPRWLGVCADLAFVAARVGEPATARALYDALLPYRGRLVVWGGANTITGPVDDYLGRLAVRLNLPDLATTHLDAAVALERRIGALPWLAGTLSVRARALTARGGEDDRLQAEDDTRQARKIAERLGLKAILAALDPPADEWRLLRDDGEWLLEAGAERARLRDGRGMEYLRALLAAPGQEVAALDLVAGGAGLRPPEEEPLLDAAARTAYRRRLRALDEQLAGADRAGDAVRAEELHAERTALLDELRRAEGLGGRPRRRSGEAERARVNATRALWTAVKRVEAAAPRAGAHLRASLRTGHLLRYHPAPGGPGRWNV